MALKLTLIDGETETFTEYIGGLDYISELDRVFKGETWLEDGEPYILYDPDPDKKDLRQIVKAEWVDADPETSFHGYVLEMMNRETPTALMDIADGNDGTHKIWDALQSYSNGFEEAVDNLIKYDGIEFVFGNSFSFHTLFSLVVREIVRDYLREHELY